MGLAGKWCALAATLATMMTTMNCGAAKSPEPAADHDVTLAPAGGSGGPTLVLSLPGDFTIARSTKGADFDLHYVTPDGGDQAAAHAVIYVGRHPTSFHGKPDAENVVAGQATARGEKVDVFSFDTKPGVAHKEAVLKGVIPGDGGLVVHLAAGGTSREALEKLWTHLLTVRAK